MKDNTQIETKLCLSCGELNHVDSIYCGKCGLPIGNMSPINPLQSINAYGSVLQKSASAPKAIHTIGIWLLFFPQIIGLLMYMFLIIDYIFLNPPYFPPEYSTYIEFQKADERDIIFLIVCSLVITLYILIITKVTKRFFKHKKQCEVDN